MYIVIEGQDGTGKSTQVRLLEEYFKKSGKEVVVMDEPDGDLPQAHDLHDLILIKGKDYNLEPNNISVNIETNNFKMFRSKVGMPIAISGHIDSKWGKRIICDIIKFI